MPHLINQLVSRLIIRFHANKIQPMYRNQLDFAPQKGYRSSTEAFSKFPKQRFIDIYQRLDDHHLDDSFLVVFSQQCETIYFSAVTSQNKKQAFSQLHWKK